MRRTLECDVLVVGTGVAGVSAAIGAARTGARTLLLGNEAGPGGVAVAGMHRSMCGLFPTGKPTPRRPINDGLVQEIFEHLHAVDPAAKVTPMGRVYVLPFATHHLVETFLDFLNAERRLEVRFETRVIAARTDRGAVCDVIAQDDEGEIDIDVLGSLVDCTGDASVIRFAGAQLDTTSPRDLQLAGQSLVIEDVANSSDLLRVKVVYHLAEGVAAGKLPRHAKFTHWIPSDVAGRGHLKLSVPPTIENREAQAREDAERAHAYLRSALPEFASSRIVDRSTRVVDREGKRIFGEYTLTEEDVLSARKFPDGVVKGAWPIELWDQEEGLRFQYLEQGEHYEIPMRCLKVAEIGNAWAAGRCISATHLAQASTRAMGTCISLGEQAGRGAALALSTP